MSALMDGLRRTALTTLPSVDTARAAPASSGAAQQAARSGFEAVSTG